MAQDTQIAWYDAPKNDAHGKLSSWLDYVSQQTRTQRLDTRICLEAVSNFNPTGNGELTYALRSQLPYKIRDNILRSGVDTVGSLVSQARTSPQYLTTAAEWQTSRIAEKRSRVLQGQMYDLKVFELVPRAFLDAAEGGTGHIHGMIGPDGMPTLDRCLPNEVYVDPESGRYGDPDEAARVKFVERRKLLAMYAPKEGPLRSRILVATGPTAQDYVDFFLRRDNKSDMVRVVYAWKRPSLPDGDDGRHVIALSNCTLVDKPYTRQRLPIVRVLYAERSQGYHGQSLVERMLPAQMRVAEIDDFTTVSQKLGSTAKWLIDAHSEVDPDQITNAACDVVDYVTTPPKLVVFEGTPQDLQTTRREIKSDIYDQEGLSSNATTGEVNKGLSSARAVRAADDTMVRRFITPARLLEQAYLNVVRLIEDLNDDCAANDNNYAPKGRYRSGRRTWLKTSKWTDLDLSESNAAVQMFPISAQATTPQGKWSSVEEWVQAGFVSKPQAMDLMEFPDTEAFEALENANLDLVHEQIDSIIDLEDGDTDMLLPIPNQDLEMAASIVNNAYLVAFRLKAPAPVLQRFDNYISYCKQQKDGAAAAANTNTAPAALDANAAAAAQLAAQPAQPAIVAA